MGHIRHRNGAGSSRELHAPAQKHEAERGCSAPAGSSQAVIPWKRVSVILPDFSKSHRKSGAIRSPSHGDVTPKATSEHTRNASRQTHGHRQPAGGPRGKGVEGRKGLGVKYMGTEGALTLGGGHTVQETDDVAQNCALQTDIILLANSPPSI